MRHITIKLIGLLTALFCITCMMLHPALSLLTNAIEPEYLGAAVNGWVATCRRAGGHPNEIGQVGLERVDDNTTRITPFNEDDGFAVTGRFESNGDMTEGTLIPSADGRYAFTVNVSSSGLDADEIYIPFGTELNGHWHRNCEITKDGLRIRLVNVK